MPALSVSEEPPERTIARLEREVVHITGQLRTEHSMMLDWKKRCIAAETQVERLEKKLDKKRRSQDGRRPDQELEGYSIASRPLK